MGEGVEGWERGWRDGEEGVTADVDNRHFCLGAETQCWVHNYTSVCPHSWSACAMDY